MAYKSLRTLMVAAGVTPASGKSFKLDVPGGNDGSGRAITDYNLSAWGSWGSDLQAPASRTYVSGELVNFTFATTAGSAWGYIRKPITDIDTLIDDGAPDASGKDAVVQSGTWDTPSANNHAMAVAVYGQYVGPNSVVLGRNWFKDFDVSESPPDSGDYDWEIVLSIQYPSLVGLYDDFNFKFFYPQTDPGTLGPFNDQLTGPNNLVRVARRYLPGDPGWTIELHDNSSYTSLVASGSSGLSYVFTKGLGNTGNQNFYARYKTSPGGSWNTILPSPIVVDDPRW